MRSACLKLGMAAILGAALGCATAPRHFSQDPFTQGGSASELFTIDWWKQVVTDVPPLEYAPREPAAPAVDPQSGTVVTLTRDGFIRAYSTEGAPRWSFKTLGRFVSSAVIRDGRVYAAGTDGVLVALGVQDGKKAWSYDAGEELVSRISLAGKLVLVASQTDTLYAVDAATGKWVWQYRRDTPSGFTIHGVSAAAVAGDAVYVGFSDGHLVCLGAADGSLRWDRTLGTGSQFIDVDTTPVIDETGRVYAADYKDGLYALDAESGDTIWHRDEPGITELAKIGKMLVAGGDERVSAFTLEHGEPLWTADVGKRSGRLPVPVDGLILVPTDEAMLFLAPATGKVVLNFNPGKGVTAPVTVAGREVYMLSNLGYLYALSFHPRAG